MLASRLPDDVLGRIEKCGVIAVLVVDEVSDAVPLARALVEGGIDVMELTLRTPVAIDALKAIRDEVPDMLAGIGTILTPEQAHQATAAGAAFGVSPGINPRVVRAAQQVGLPFAPGIATPTDLEAALELGCVHVKFFPAESLGGLAYLKSMAAPYVHLGVRFVPLGGLSLANMADYLRDPLILAVGGSWLAPRTEIRTGDFARIRARAAEARRQVETLRRR
ncbi:MAG: bifunctional 4-hydroxy-2-oxoglutarate aldolase/2-dehydro-3-deoxy-phosphogluconate aldolase [Planctomycetes bacterium]|nr:bifunctional 4-hydroxy-2-oxoglutarate aldolase/2-dehydro-3-deoxy-phosphogluconate aldolase [Planctomycetota bacterium]